jgi:hypothetical protein
VGSGYLYRCFVCDGDGHWRIERRGDVATTWSCADHFTEVAEHMQRDHEVTQLTVTLASKAAEWGEITRMLRSVGTTPGDNHD